MAKSGTSKKTSFMEFLRAFIALALCIGGLYWLFSAFVARLNEINTDLGKAIVGGIIAIIVAIVTSAFGKAWEQRNKRLQEVHEKKTPIYEEQIAVLFRIMFATKFEGSQPSAEDIAKSFMGFTEKLMIWGGPKVIKSWQEFRTFAPPKNDPWAHLNKFADFMLALRADVGNSNSGITRADLLKLFINDYSEEDLDGEPRKGLEGSSSS